MTQQRLHPAGRAVVFTGPERVELRSFEARRPGPGEVLVESVFTCISPGTELRRLSGREMVGNSAFPLAPGYCLAGRVIERGAGVSIPVGAPVATFGSAYAGGFNPGEGGHVSHALLPASQTVPVPAGVDLLDASACVLAGIAWHGARRAQVGAGDRVAVIGLGVIGQMAARVCAAAGAEVVGCDRSPRRTAALAAVGIPAVTAQGGAGAALSPFFPEGADVIVDSTGAADVMADALTIARRRAWDPLRDVPSARCLVLGSPKEDLRVPYADAYACQCSILFSTGSQLSDCAAALEMVAQGRLRVRDTITEVCPPDAAPEIYRRLSDPAGGLLTAAFQWSRMRPMESF